MTATYRILVTDDNPGNRAVLVRSLRKSGYETLEAADGEEALRLAKSEAPSLILLDVGMPGRSGFEVCEALKASPETAETPVIFLTARSEPEDIERAFAVGGSDYVTKPFHLGEVKARLSVHLQLFQAKRSLQETHAQLLHAQKLESIGQLAAGIAHEINTPTQFVGDNTRFLQESFEELLPLLLGAVRLTETVCNGEAGDQLAADLRGGFEEADADYLAEEIPRAISQSLEGLRRVSAIVRAMREFSHPGVTDMASVDLNRAIESTVTVASNEWKYVADVDLDLDPALPAVQCFPGELNQVFLNMIVNAAHAIADIVGDAADGKGTIRISTRLAGDAAEVRIADTGTGIPEAVRARVFDPFFTTKAVGKGTGQGLSIAHNVVVQKHGGTIGLESETGKGTTFVVRIPIEQSAEEPAEDRQDRAAATNPQ